MSQLGVGDVSIIVENLITVSKISLCELNKWFNLVVFFDLLDAPTQLATANNRGIMKTIYSLSVVTERGEELIVK